MTSMVLEEILISMLIMVEFIEDLLSKAKESSKSDLFPVKDNSGKDLFISRENHFIILEMARVETAILCTLSFYLVLIREESPKVEIGSTILNF
jgi:hypothetical protein